MTTPADKARLDTLDAQLRGVGLRLHAHAYNGSRRRYSATIGPIAPSADRVVGYGVDLGDAIDNALKVWQQRARTATRRRSRREN